MEDLLELLYSSIIAFVVLLIPLAPILSAIVVIVIKSMWWQEDLEEYRRKKQKSPEQLSELEAASNARIQRLKESQKMEEFRIAENKKRIKEGKRELWVLDPETGKEFPQAKKRDA